jgi:hypothetical protein
MRVTGLSRTGFLACPLLVALVWPVHANDDQDIWDVLTQAASALSEGNARNFLAAFDRAMPGYNTLDANVSALLDQCQVQSSIEILRQEGTGAMRNVELDWFLQVVEQHETAEVVRRRERVRCRLARQGKKWRITSLEPLSLFAPPAQR